MRILSRFLVAASLLVPSFGAPAAVSTFDSFSSFSAATSGITSFDFSGVDTQPFGSSVPFNTGSPLTLNGTLTISPENLGFVLSSDYFAPAGGPYGPDKFFTSQQGASNSITITSSSPIYGLGFYFGSYNGPVSGAGVSVSLGGGSVVFPAQVAAENVADGSKLAFVGIVSSTAFTSVTFTPTAGDNGVPNSFDVTRLYTAITPVPEPSLPLMLVVGLGLIGMVVRRKNA